MARYFLYGTLMDPDVTRRVVGRPLAALAPAPAELRGFVRVYVRGASFPGLAAAPDGVVPGLVAGPLTRPEALRVAAYEGPDYDLREMPVVLADGVEAPVRVFVPKRGVGLTRRPWSLPAWQRLEKSRFLRGL